MDEGVDQMVIMKQWNGSSTSCTRTLLVQHDISPSDASKKDIKTTLFSPMTFQPTIYGGHDMEYRIVEKDAFQLVGIKQRITLQEGANPPIDQMWTKLKTSEMEEWKAMSSGEPEGLLSITIRLDESGAQLEHHIGVATTNYQGNKWDVLDVPASFWAVFTSRGEFPNTLQTMWTRIYTEWLPSSGYELIGAPEMLWNEGPDISKPDYHSEIWLRIRKM